MVYECLKRFLLKNIAEQSMIKQEIIKSCLLSLLFCMNQLILADQNIKCLIPFLKKLFFGHECIVLFDTCMSNECRRVSSNSNFYINFSHFPGSFSLFVVGKVDRNELYKYLANALKFFFKFLTVKLIRIVHNAAIIESCDDQAFL